MAVDPARAKSLFLAASELPNVDRAAYLDRECAGDAELRTRVEALLTGDLPRADCASRKRTSVRLPPSSTPSPSLRR